MPAFNRQITLASRPVGLPKVADFHLVYSPVPSPAQGEVLVRSIYLSLDPSTRGLMSENGSVARPVAIGGVIPGGAVASVVESMDARFQAGDTVEGMLGWQEYAVAQGRELRTVDPNLAPISTALGVLGVPGLTAYFGLLDICHPQPGETVVVSGAAGGIGMIVGQIAKIRGCRVVGITGAGVATSWLLDELGFDAVLDFGTPESSNGRLARACPAGVDVYFDNVGGTTTDAVMRLINDRARIAVCGQTSEYNLEEPELGPRWLGRLIVTQARAEGFLVSGFLERFPEGLRQLASWLTHGNLKYREEISQGIEAAPQAFIGMLQGRNQGKQLVQLSEL